MRLEKALTKLHHYLHHHYLKDTAFVDFDYFAIIPHWLREIITQADCRRDGNIYNLEWEAGLKNLPTVRSLNSQRVLRGTNFQKKKELFSN